MEYPEYYALVVSDPEGATRVLGPLTMPDAMQQREWLWDEHECSINLVPIDDDIIEVDAWLGHK